MKIEYTYPELKGSVCVVTGAGGGIGRQVCLDLARSGASLFLIDARQAQCDAVAEEARQLGATCEVAVQDITDLDLLGQAASRCRERLGNCTVLVNTIAISGRPDSLFDLTLPKWERQIAVNLTSCFTTAQVFAAQMRDAGGGSIVHVGSLAGHTPQINSGAYSVSKAGVGMLSRLMAHEWGPYGIRSNVVSPAMVRTEMSERLYSDPHVLASRENLVPLRTIATSSQISDVVLFLASPRAAYVTGQELLVDGGISQVLMSQFAGLPTPPATA